MLFFCSREDACLCTPSQNNGVLDSNLNWIDESTTVMSVGDTIGRGHQDREVLTFIKEQMDAGHRWFQNLGNHEIMQLRNDWRYAIDSSSAGWGNLAARQVCLLLRTTLRIFQFNQWGITSAQRWNFDALEC